MKKLSILAIILLGLLLTSCNSEPTLQKYFVENSESRDFILLDITANILKVDQASLSEKERKALETVKKMNILAFKKDSLDDSKFEVEKAKVQHILKDEKYQELIKVNSGKDGAAVYFVGKDDAIDEFVLYGNQKDAGFAVVRVLGDDMNPNSIMTLLSILQKADVQLDQLKPLQAMLPK